MKIVESIALISINATLIFQLLSFLLFMVLIHRVMIRPLNRAMAERGLMIDRIERDIESAQDELHQISKQMEDQEAAARETAFKIRDDVEAAGERHASEVITKTRAQIELLKQQAEQHIDGQLSEARKGMEAAAAGIGDRLVSSLLGRKVVLK